uniref:Uncharacterized protein n=1 Tax=Anguilla anguilla TaxID=7936 RepID=A0A0E9PJ57_ANGAN
MHKIYRKRPAGPQNLQLETELSSCPKNYLLVVYISFNNQLLVRSVGAAFE